VALTSLLECGKKNRDEEKKERIKKKTSSHTLYSKFDVHNEDEVFQ
jgi:hypothetical protein